MTDVQFRGPEEPEAPRRRRGGLVAVAALAVVSFVVWAGVRGPQDAAAPSSTSTTSTTEAGAAETTVTSASAEEGRVDEPASAGAIAAQRWAIGGSSSASSVIRSGVPLGYERNESGASAAATNFLVATAGLGIHLDEERWNALSSAALADPGSAEVKKLHRDAITYLDSIGITSTADLKDLASTFEPVSASVVDYSSTEATVDVWGVSLFGRRGGGGGNGPVASWQTWRMTVVWKGGDWRLAEGLGEQLRDGPTPAPSAPASPADDVVTAAGGAG